MFWFKNLWKDKNSHIPQTIYSQGPELIHSNNPHDHTMRVIWSPESKLLIELKPYNILCHLEVTLQHERFYHFAMSGGSNTTMKIYLNGIDVNPICYKDGGLTTESRVVIGKYSTLKIANRVPIYLGSSNPIWGNPDDNYFKGSITDFRIYTKPLTVSQIYSAMLFSSDSQDNNSPEKFLFMDQKLRSDCNVGSIPETSSASAQQSESLADNLVAVKSKILHKTLPPPSKLASAAMVHISGSPAMGQLNHGDRYLSVMLSVVETKLALSSLSSSDGEAQHGIASASQELLGPLSSIVVDNLEALQSIQQSLRRHFEVLLDQTHLWTSYNEYAIRLEMLGHSIALLLKQQTQSQLQSQAQSQAQPQSPASEHSETKKQPVIAIIAPATSKGIPPNRLDRLALVKSLVPSLYKTRSKGYTYRIYLSVNENDPIFSNTILTTALFDSMYAMQKEEFYQNLTKSSPTDESLNELFPPISYKVIVVPSSMIPKRALSGLFNIPTLIAYEEGCDYFYVVNDDLYFKSQKWTEALVNPLLNNPIYPGLGVSGGVDVSDSETPQIEFPFFSRLHVELFPWCGTNPWIFKNWWEDNWLTDVYLPFNSIFYERGVVVENYVGVESDPTPDTVSSKTADPRYEVDDGRRTPPFYVAEVESARQRILDFLNGIDQPMRCETRDFGHQSVSHKRDVVEKESLELSYPQNMSYCFEMKKRTPSLALMPVHPHEDALDPCDSKITSIKEYRQRIHAREIPHVSYASMVPCGHDSTSINHDSSSNSQHILSEVLSSCMPYSNNDHSRSSLMTSTIDDLDNESHKAWMECIQKIGLAYQFNTRALTQGFLCLPNLLDPNIEPFSSCKQKKLKILIVHNHCPLFTRYGSDKRLYHIAETMVGLGHDVSFGGMFVSSLETDDDHNRLKNIRAQLYSPLALMEDNKVIPNTKVYQKVLKVINPDLVIFTLWFWNIPSTFETFYLLTRSTLPSSSKIGVLSDDAHTFREMKRKKFSLPPPQSSQKKKKLFNKNAEQFLQQKQNKTMNLDPDVRTIYIKESSAYEKADVVLTITEDDKEKMLMTIDQEFDSLLRLAFGENVEYTPTTTLGSKFQVVRYALSPTEIIPDEGKKLRYEGGGVMDGSQRSQLSFVGNGVNPTNQDAMSWFLEKIFPLIKEKIPDMKLIIIGADWNYLIEKYPEHQDSLVIRGLLSQEDMTAALLTSKVFVSPIVASTGLNTKNLLALSRGLPMVTTVDGSHGLMYSPDTYTETYPPFYITKSTEEFVEKVLELYNNNELWQETALAALRHARNSFSLSTQAREVDRVFKIALPDR